MTKALSLVGHVSSSVQNERAESAFLTAEDRQRDVENARNSARALLALEEVQRLTAKHAVAAQAILRNGSALGIWETPREWAPMIVQTLYRVDLRQRVKDFLPTVVQEPANATPASLSDEARLERLLDRAVLRMTQYLVLCRIGPVGMKRSTSESLDPSTIALHAYNYLPRMAASAIVRLLQEDRPGNEESFFSAFEPEDLAALKGSARQLVGVEVTRMHMLSVRGLWADAPPHASATKTTPVAGKAIPPRQVRKSDPHKPLPDDYISEMGRKASWLIEHLGPNIVSVLGQFRPLWERGIRQAAADSTITRWCGELLAKFEWKDADGRDIKELPFPLRLSLKGKAAEADDSFDQWPPSGPAQIFGLAHALQAAHLAVALLSSGPRASEILTLERNCVAYARDGEQYANGRTYKLVKRHDGAERDWTLPNFAVQAIEQQARLIAVVERLSPIGSFTKGQAFQGGFHLWGVISAGSQDKAKPMGIHDLNLALRGFARMLDMSTKPGGQALRSHRFRKTLARLAALAIVEAPKVLMDVFGHKSIEMTLYYILEDKDLRAEIETIARELRVMRATTVIAEMVAAEETHEVIRAAADEPDSGSDIVNLGGYGGMAAGRIQRAIQARRDELHRTGEAWGAKDMHELAELLTMRGTAWQLVRPGVICTKTVGQVGPCNKRKGNPEPSRCQSGCDSRLEEAWHQEDVDASIAEAIDLYVESGAQGADLVQGFWRNQILGHLPRFPHLKDKWLTNDVVKSILQTEEQA